MTRKFVGVALSIAVLTVVFFPAHAAVWGVNGGGLISWFTQGVNGSGIQNIYESGFGTNPQFPNARTSGYNCFRIGGLTDLTCGDDAGEGAVPEIWGAPAVYSGTIRDFGEAIPGGTISWTGESGTAALTGIELFTSSVVSGSYDIASGALTGTFNCWNNPAAVNSYGADFCGNGTGGATPTTLAGQTLANRSLPNGMIGLTENIVDGFQTLMVTLSDTSYNSCLSAMDGSCDSSSSNTYATWALISPCATSDGACCGTFDTDPCAEIVAIPPALWLFGSALGLLGWIRRNWGRS